MSHAYKTLTAISKSSAVMELSLNLRLLCLYSTALLSRLQAQAVLQHTTSHVLSPVIDSGDIHSPVSTQDVQLAASVDVLAPSQGHELLDNEGKSVIPHVLPGNARQAWVGEYVSIA